MTNTSSTLGIFIKSVTTPAIVVIFFLVFWVFFACVRAITRSSSRKTSFFAEIGEGETWQIYKMKEVTLSVCKNKFSGNCFSTADEAHAVFACPVTADDSATPPADDSAATEPYMLRPLPLDEPTGGKPSGCNI